MTNDILVIYLMTISRFEKSAINLMAAAMKKYFLMAAASN
jgi:hypothetical protein